MRELVSEWVIKWLINIDLCSKGDIFELDLTVDTIILGLLGHERCMKNWSNTWFSTVLNHRNTHTRTNKHTHTCMHTYIHTYIHTHIHTHTPTHTPTHPPSHTLSLSLSFSLSLSLSLSLSQQRLDKLQFSLSDLIPLNGIELTNRSHGL